MQLITFYLGEEEYGIETKFVIEIIKFREITKVPEYPFFIEGVINLRGAVVPILSLRKRFSLIEKEESEDSKIIIVKADNINLGLICDKVAKVITLDKSSLESVPRVSERQNFLSLIGRVNEHLILIIDLDKILTEEQKKILREKEEKITEEEILTPQLQLVCFSLSDEWYALNLEDVQEIVSIGKIFNVPQSPPLVSGMINLRGNIVSVVNIKPILELEERNQTEDNRIIIVKKESKLFGVLVDKIFKVIKVDENSLEPPIATISGKKQDYIKGVKKIEDKLLVLLDFDKIIDLHLKE